MRKEGKYARICRTHRDSGIETASASQGQDKVDDLGTKPPWRLDEARDVTYAWWTGIRIRWSAESAMRPAYHAKSLSSVP